MNEPDQGTPLVAPLDRDVLLVTGSDAATYLQGQLSQDVSALAPGEAARAFLLSPQGKVVSWLRVTRTAEDRFLLDTEVGWGDTMRARLERFKLRTAVSFESSTWHTLAFRGVGAHSLAVACADGDCVLVDAGWPGEPAVDLLGPSVLAPSHVVVASFDDYESARVRAGVPAMGSEIDDSTIPAELGQWAIDRSVSFTKGCYTGQELVARIDSRGGNVPRPIRRVVIAGSGDAEPAAWRRAEVTDGQSGKLLGHLTTVVPGDERGEMLALAVLARAADQDTPLAIEAEGVSAQARVVPTTSDGGTLGTSN